MFVPWTSLEFENSSKADLARIKLYILLRRPGPAGIYPENLKLPHKPTNTDVNIFCMEIS